MSARSPGDVRVLLKPDDTSAPLELLNKPFGKAESVRALIDAARAGFAGVRRRRHTASIPPPNQLVAFLREPGGRRASASEDRGNQKPSARGLSRLRAAARGRTRLANWFAAAFWRRSGDAGISRP